MGLYITYAQRPEVPIEHRKIFVELAVFMGLQDEKRIREWRARYWYLIPRYKKGTWNEDLKGKWSSWWMKAGTPNGSAQEKAFVAKLREEYLIKAGWKI
ncbi:hypothetical protein [Thermus brockianus]